MAGLFGFASHDGQGASFAEMRVRATLYDWYTGSERTTDEGRIALGSAGLTGLEKSAESKDGSFILIYGEIFEGEKDPESLLNNILQMGKSAFELVDGRFQAVVWNAKTRELVLATDLYATRPLYWAKSATGFAFASQVKTLMAVPGVGRSGSGLAISQEALVDFFTWGHYFHTHTSLEGVEVLPPAGFYTFCMADGTLRKETYHDFQTSGPETTTDDVAEAFHRAVLRQTTDTGHLGISLSGGLDARSILGMVPAEAQRSMVSVSLGVPGSADHRLATQLARLAGTRHFNYELNTDFLRTYRENLAEMVRLTDGQYLSASIVIPTLPFYREHGIQTLLRGHAGELFHMSKAYAFSLTEAARQSFSTGDAPHDRETLTNWAFSHLQAYMLSGVTTGLLRGVSLNDFQSIARSSLLRALSDAGLDTNSRVSDTLWHLYLRQRVFREIPLSMRKFDSHVNVRLPILDRELLDVLFRLPPENRMNERIQARILARYRPDFLRVKNVNTGTYIGAGPVRQHLASLKHRVLAKLRFPGYQPYEKMGLWLRRELRPLVSELLLSGNFPDRGIFEPDTVRDVVRTHLEGSNHTYLLLALMIMEMQMRFLEKDAF